MRKIILYFIIFYSLKLFSVGLPHAVYFQVYAIEKGKVVYPDSVSFTAWITDREDEVLTEKSFGCGFNKQHSLVTVQVGNFITPWKAGELLNIEIKTKIGNGFRTIELNNNSYQYFVRNYKGDDGILLTKSEENKNIQILPNPFSEYIIIKAPEKLKGERLDILKSNKLIKTIILQDSLYIKTKKFKPGIYIFKVNSNNFSKKLIKIN